MYWLGIDVGTGGTRALLVDARGKVQHSFTSPHEDMRMEHPLWAEQRPENWWDAAQLQFEECLQRPAPRARTSAESGYRARCTGLVLLGRC